MHPWKNGLAAHRRDALIISVALLAALGLYLVSRIAPGENVTTVLVTINGEEVLRRPLAVNATYEIPQEDGAVNVIRVENGEVYMLEANCRDGLCIQQGRMKNMAKTIVCLPHGLVVRLTGAESDGPTEDGLDVILQ